MSSATAPDQSDPPHRSVHPGWADPAWSNPADWRPWQQPAGMPSGAGGNPPVNGAVGPPWAAIGVGQPAPGERRRRARALGIEIIVGLIAGLVTAALGFPLGWLWQALAPGTPVLKVADGVIYAAPEQEQVIAGEGWFVFLAAGVGVLVALIAWVALRRFRGVPLLVGVLLGAVWCGKVAAWFGRWLGWDTFKHLALTAPPGTAFTLPVHLRVGHIESMWLPYARGDVLTVAIAVAVVSLLLVGFSSRPGLRPGSESGEQLSVPAPVPGYPSAWNGEQAPMSENRLISPANPTPTDGATPPAGAVSTDGIAQAGGAVPSDGTVPTDGAVPPGSPHERPQQG